MEVSNYIFWDWKVAVYLFVAGISAGAFAVSALALLIDKEKYLDVIRIGAYIAPFPLMFGLLCLIFDLERPYLFWKLLITFQAHSIMSLGSWLLLIFSALSFVYFYLWLPDGFDVVEFLRRTPRRWDSWAIIRLYKGNFLFEILHRKNLNKLKGCVAMIAAPIALSVGIYTGLLLGVLVARPFWSSPMLPLLFLVSALKTGTASIGFIDFFIRGLGGKNREKIETNKFMIHCVDFFLMILSLIVILLFVFGLYTSSQNSVEAASLIMGGEFTFLFWGMAVVVGIFFPFVLELYELIPHFTKHVKMREHNPWISGIITVSVLVGGFFLRYVVVYAGQAAKIVNL